MSDANQRLQRIEELILKFEGSPDPNTRADAQRLVQAIMAFHAEAIDRMMEIVVEEAGGQDTLPSAIESFTRDEMVSGLLILHGLHPLDFETRVARALDKVRPVLRGQASDVELLRIEGEAVHLRFDGKPDQRLRRSIEEEIHRFAPEASEINIEGIEIPQAERLIQLTL